MESFGIVWSTFTLDAFLTVIDVIYKDLFCHRPFDGLSIIIKNYQIVCKKKGI